MNTEAGQVIITVDHSGQIFLALLIVMLIYVLAKAAGND